MDNNSLIELCLEMGAFKAGITDVDKITFDETLRQFCEANVCGHYNKNYACPPSVGDPKTVIHKAKQYQKALVFQTVSDLEDSFDIEGMQEASFRHTEIAEKINEKLKNELGDYLRLMAGGCPICPVCGMAEGKPCSHPDRCIASLEAYCINVSDLAKQCDMKYINGQDTVTYFGAFLFHE